MADNNQTPNNEEKRNPIKPLKGGGSITKNLFTLPDGNRDDVESILDQIVDAPADKKPAPSESRGNNDSK